MNFKRLWTIFKTRNREFFRDRSAFGWNFLFPFLIIGGFAIIFGGREYTEYKIGVFPCEPGTFNIEETNIPAQFQKTRYMKFIAFQTAAQGLEKLKHHKIDFLIKNGPSTNEYWVSDSSPKGYIVEKIYTSSFMPQSKKENANKKKIQGSEIRYIDWLFPGILAMNMMFSALWGVGFIIVRYRKNGVLKRLKVTPLTAFEYLSAQLLSRIYVLMFSLVIVWIGCDLVFSFKVQGSYLVLLLVFFIGGLSLCALGLLLASRGTSEEFTSGVVNFITWPMMFLSEVWFSLEGSPKWVKMFSLAFPLTHMLKAARRVMNDGAGLLNISQELIVLSAMTLIFLTIGASLFSWNK